MHPKGKTVSRAEPGGGKNRALMVVRSLLITHTHTHAPPDSPAKKTLLPSDPLCRQGNRHLMELNVSVKVTQLPCVSVRTGTQVGEEGPAFTAFDGGRGQGRFALLFPPPSLIS